MGLDRLKTITLIVYFCTASCTTLFTNVYPRIEIGIEGVKDPGEPLFLTPFIRNGSLAQGRRLARVHLPQLPALDSYAGFLTIDHKYNSNLYFWYFRPLIKKQDAPVLLWLQGGPGATSLFGLFTEIGPIEVTKDGNFTLRKHSWASDYNVIFIDNPVGTGFSFTDYQVGYCNNEDCIGLGLYKAMQQFFTLFPELRKNDFYITGESYAGKYIPALAMQIHVQNAKGEKNINLQGMAMGNAYCDPIHQMDYANYLYQHGLIDDKQKNIFETYQKDIAAAINGNDWAKADILMDRLMDGDLSNTSYFKTFTGFNNYYNYLLAEDDTDITMFAKILAKDEVRRSVHVGGRPFNSGKDVMIHLISDVLKSQAPVISKLLSHYRILFYNGQLDIIVAYPLTESFLRHLEFSSSAEYLRARRSIWRVEGEVGGYYKRAGNLTELLVRDAGHMVPHDQPSWAHYMIQQFIHNTFS